jgi:hypothetical protein
MPETENKTGIIHCTPVKSTDAVKKETAGKGFSVDPAAGQHTAPPLNAVWCPL